MQTIASDPEYSSDSLEYIINDLNIGFPQDDRYTTQMITNNLDTQQAFDVTTLNPTLIQANEENRQNTWNCQGKKVSLTELLKIKLNKILDLRTQYVLLISIYHQQQILTPLQLRTRLCL